MALDRLKLTERYYLFDRGGWHFIILDNIMRRPPLYYGNLDAEQDEWLTADLAKNKLPAVVVTHIPLLSMTSLFDGGKKSAGDNYVTSDANMHHDVRPLLKRLAAHNVKLALSGHWWKGPHLEFGEGYGIIDLHPDGMVENHYVSFGWKAAV